MVLPRVRHIKDHALARKGDVAKTKILKLKSNEIFPITGFLDVKQEDRQTCIYNVFSTSE